MSKMGQHIVNQMETERGRDELKKIDIEEAKKQERKRIITHLNKLCKYNPIKGEALRIELGKYIKKLKEEKNA